MKNLYHKLRLGATALFVGMATFAYADTTFDVQVSNITETDASVMVTPSSDDASYCMTYATKADFLAAGGVDKVIDNQIQEWKDEIWGDQTWQQVAYWDIHTGTYVYSSLAQLEYEPLLPGTDYVVSVFGIESGTGNITTGVTTKEFRTLGDSPVVGDNSIFINVSDITTTDAYLSFTPSDNNIGYCFFVKSKAEFDAAGGVDKVIDNQIAAWTRTASYYDEDWTYMMSIYAQHGAHGELASESYGSLTPETDYVAYAFAIDNDKNVIVPVVTKEFTTLGVQKSDNTFTLSVVSITATSSRRNTVVAKSVPTNDDTYTVKCLLKSYVDGYDLTDPAKEQEFIDEYMTYPLYANQIVSGEHTWTFENQSNDTDYCLVAMGVTEDKAPTTGLTVLPFKCVEQTEPELGSVTTTIRDITSTDAYMSFTPSDDSLPYCFFIDSKADFDANGGADKAIENKVAYWTRMAETYDSTWPEMMAVFAHKGPYAEYASESYGNLSPETEYVVYTFAIDAEQNILAPVETTTFTTQGVEKSDNTFTLSVTSITPTSSTRNTVVALSVPSNSDTYNVKCILKANVDKYDLEDAAQEKEFIEEYMMYPLYSNQIVSGEHTWTFENLSNNTEYCLVAMGVSEDKAATTGVTIFPFLCGEMHNPVEGTIALNVTDITAMDARIQITPSNEEIRYFYDVTTKELVDEKGGVDAIAQEFVVEWFKYLADFYEDTTWVDVMKLLTTTGNIDEMASALQEEGMLSNFYWNQNLVLYAVGFDNAGNIVTPTATFDFKTPDHGTSDMTFDFQFVSSEINEDYSSVFTATVDVYPSVTGQEYKVNYCADRIFDQYDESNEEDMFEYITYQFYPSAATFDDAARLVFPDLYVKDVYGDNQYYYVIAMGWDGGPSTPLYKYTFSVDSNGVSVVENNDVIVYGTEGMIIVQGDIENAVVFNTSGQMVGALHGSGKVNLPGGIYLVRYVVDGKPVTAKVLVK
ncbi:MAG: hypothetical protein NC217_05425 [Muribaculaceae bacterium]|nr:hypothetical protein [Muribaculaceae bacterium]